MIKQTLLKRELFVRGPKVFGLAIFCVVSVLIAVLTLIQPVSKVQAATNNNLNFQARLQTAGGALAADGYYNIEFKLYSASSGGSALWTETYYDSNGATAGNDNRVRVKNGYLTVNLGSQTSFPAINWDQELWISMNVGGVTQTATPTWDGEMSPRLKLTGVPYAFRAGELAKYNSATGFTGVLQFQATTGGNQTFLIPDQGAAGTYTILTTSAASGSYIQNTTTLQTSSNFHISGDGKAVTSLQTPLLDTISAGTLSIGTGTATSLSLSKSGATTTVNGALAVTEATTLNGNVTVGNATTDRLTVTSQILGGSPLVFQGATDDSNTTTLSLVDPTGNNIITLPNASGTVQLAPTSGSYIQQVPSATADNTITPTAASVVGLTVNATNNATGAIAAVINQSRAFTALDINTTNAAGTQTNAVQIARNGAGGTTTNLLNLTNTTGTATHGLTFTGTFATNLINAPNFTVSNGGAITGVGVNSGTGLIQGTGGLTVTGTALINATGTANTQIGNATGTFQLDSNTIDISSAGAVSGITGLAMASGDFSQAGTGTFSTGTGAISLNGDTTVTTGKALTVTAGATNLTGAAAGNGVSTTINTGAATNVGLVVKGASGQTADLLQIQDSTGANLIHASGSTLQAMGYIGNPWGGVGVAANLILHSEAFDNAVWVKTNVTNPTANTITDPRGSTGAESLATTASGGSVAQTSSTAASNTNFTFAVWLKAASGTQNVDLRIDGATSGTGTAKTVTATTTWQRFWVTQNTNGFSGNVRASIFPGTTSGTGTIHASGAQLSQSSGPVIYLSTTTGTLTTQSGLVSSVSLFVGSSSILNGGLTVNNSGATFNAGATITTGNGLTLGSVGTNNGGIVFRSSSVGSGAVTLRVSTTQGATARTLTLPDEDGTLCVQGSTNCGFALSATNGYVQLAPSAAQTDATTNSSIFINKTGASGNLVQLQNGGSDVFTVSGVGALTAVGVNAGTGLLQGTGGLTLTGAVAINTTGTANTAIGNSTGTLTLSSNTFNLSSAGAISGVTDYAQASGNFAITGAGTFSTGTGAISLNGDTTIANDKRLSIGSTSGLASAFAVTAPGGAELNVKTNGGLRVSIGDTASCTNGRFCVEQAITGATAGTFHNSYNTQTITSSGGANVVTAVGQQIVIQDTGSTAGNEIRGLFVDTTGTTNTGTAIQGLWVRNPSANTGNLLRLQTGTTDRFVVNNNAALVHTYGATSNSTAHTLTLNNTSGTQTNALLIDRNGSGGTTTNLINLTNTAGTVSNAINISSGTFTTGINLNGATFTNLIDSANFDVSNAGAITAVGVNSGSGLLQGSGGLTVTGATSVNNNNNSATDINTGTSTGLVSIGGGSGTFALNTTNIDISAAGAISNATGIDMASGNFIQNGTGTFGTGTGAVSLNGNTTVTSGNSLTVAGGTVAFQKGTDYSTTGTSNNVNLGNSALIRLTGASAQTITGIAGGVDGRLLTIINAGSATAVISNNSGSSSAANRITTGTGSDINLTVGASISMVYDSTASLWRVTGASAATGGAGVNTIGTFNDATSYANGAQISGTTLTFGAADATNPGLVSTAAQTFAGAKTFNGQIIGAAGISSTGGAVSLTGNAASSLTTTSGALTLTSAAAATWSTTAGNLTLQAGSGTVSLGTSTTLTADGALTVQSTGATNLTLDTGGAATLNLGNTNATTINLGTNNNNPTINIGTGNGNDTVNIATGSGTNAVSIGNSSGTNTIGIVGATTMTAGAAGQIPLTAQGVSGQTASLVQVKTHSSGTLALNIQADGSAAFLGAQPAAVTSGNGTTAGSFGYSFTATGAQGGNTSAAGQAAGNGGSLSLTGGAGGNATGGTGTAGSGGSIILQGGAPGTGTTSGFYGNVSIQASGGYTGIGTAAGLNTLLVRGVTTADLLATSIFGTGSTGFKGIVVQGVAGQTANLFELQDSAGSILMSANAGAHLETLGGYNNPWGGIGAYGNLLVHSEAFDNAIWTRSNVTAPTANTITDPLGGTTAEALATSAAVGSIGQTSTTATSNNNFTFSVWLKTASGTQSVILRVDGSSSGTGTGKFVTATTTWQRFFVTQNTNGFTGNVRGVIFPGGLGTGTVHGWGASLQLSSTPGVYVQTGASSVAAANGIAGHNIYTPGTLTVGGAATASTYNGLTLTSAADGFTVAGGTTSRTLTVTGANITVGSTIQPTSNGALAIQSTGNGNNMTVDTGGTGSTLNLGTTNAATIAIGNGSSALNFNVPTAQFTESATARTLTVQTRSTANVGTGLNVVAGTGNGANAGGVLTVQGGTGGATGGGGATQIYGGNAGGGNTNGGNVTISGGTKSGSGTGGSVIIKPQSGNDSTTAFQVQNASGTALMNVNTTSNAISLLSTLTPDITSWTDLTGTPLTAARSSHALTYGNGYVYAIGGGGNTTTYYSKVNSDGTLAGWSTTTTISGATTGTDEANAVFLNGYVYYIGGSNGGSAVDTVIYAKQNADGTLGSWTSATGLPSGRISPVIMTAYGNIYVMGGNNGTPSTSVYHAKPGADGAISSWTTSGNTLPLARHYPGGTSVNGVLYVVGGADTSFNSTNTVFHATVNPVTGAVGSWTNSGSTLPANRLANVVYAANGYLYSTAGEDSGVHNQTYYSRINSNGTLNAWGTLGSTANLPVNNAFGRAFVANGYVYLVGGYNGTTEVATVYSSSFPRVQIGGNLDLLGLQGANMNDGSDGSSGTIGGSITAGNIRAAGILEVAGAALINGGAVIAGNSVLDAVSANSLVFNESGSARTIGVQTRTSTGVGTALTVSAGGGNGSSAGGVLTLQGGNSGASGNVNGGNVNITGGTGNGTGARGLVIIDTPTVNTTTTDANCGATTAVNCTIAAGTVNNTSSVIVGASASNVTISMPDPTITTAGRIFYFTAANASQDFTLSLNGGGTGNTIAMRQNTTATLIWNGNDWTAAGASSSTTLQSAYDSTLSSAGGAEIVLNNTASSNGLTIRNNATNPIAGGLLEIQTSIGSNLFSVNNNATEYANNGGAESSTFTMWTGAPAGGTVSQSTAAGTMATGTASVSVVTTTTSHGAENTLTTTLTNNLQYTVSFTAKAASASFSTLDVLYSQDGSATTSCATGKTVTTAIWTRVSCTFTAPASGITAANSIFIRQSDGTGRTFYIDNLSVNVNASTNHAADGSVDSALGTNWTAYDADGGAGTTTPTRDTSTIYDSSGSVQDVTTAHANLGVRNNMPIVPSVSTQYLVSFYARSSNTFNDIRVGFLPAGGNGTPAAAQLCSDYNTQTVGVGSWTKITCIITTPSSGITDPDLVIYQPTATARTFHVDALTISLNTNTASNVQVGGGSNGGPATLFTLDRSATAPIAANNDAYLGSMYYDITTGRIQCYEADGWGACGAAPDTSVVLTPEYTGAVLNGTGIGTLTADFCSNQAGVLSVNTSFCASGLSRNYYKWTSPQATMQTYSIYVSYKLPSTFKTFNDDSTINLTALSDDTTNSAVTYELFRSSGSSVSRCYDGGTNETAVTSVDDTWQTVGINGNEATSCGFAAGDNVIFKINVKAQSNANVYVENLIFTYTNK